MTQFGRTRDHGAMAWLTGQSERRVVKAEFGSKTFARRGDGVVGGRRLKEERPQGRKCVRVAEEVRFRGCACAKVYCQGRAEARSIAHEITGVVAADSN